MSDRSTTSRLAISSKDLRVQPTAIVRRPRIARTCRLACALATLAVVGMGALSASATPALADGCPNEQLRSENNSTRLPECRAYEMVTPLYKEGFPLIPQTFSDEGAVAYVSTGNFAGSSQGVVNNQYVARRSAAGWTTTSLDPPAATFNEAIAFGAFALSADLRFSLWKAQRLEPPADDEYSFYLRGPDSSFTRVGDEGGGEAIEVQGTATDLSHIIFKHGESGERTIYEYVGTGNEGPARVVSVDNNGQQQAGCFDRVSSDGRVAVYTVACTSELWARLGGAGSVLVSGSQCTRSSGDPGGACNAPSGAGFAGMATDGSRVYFTTTQQLVNGDTDQTNDLYECDIPPGVPAPVGEANPCASLTEVSHNATGANVENVVNVSEDGSRVYFVATGVLASNLGTNDAAAVAGDNNLYVWEKDAAHPAGQTTFVAKLESDDVPPAGSLFANTQSTADGRYLVFQTANSLLASDTDEAPDVYRYDAATGTLLRLSTDTSGTAGNTPGLGAQLAHPQSNQPNATVTADGSTVVFETTEALSPADTDGVTDVYEWHEGQVSLISSGGGFVLGITPSGRDILFDTGQALTAGDSGLEGDFYAARVEGGFPASTPQPCSGEACHGSLALQPQVPGASGSAMLSGPGSPPTSETPPASQPKSKPQTTAQKLAKALKACKSKHNRKKRKACEKRARTTYRRAK